MKNLSLFLLSYIESSIDSGAEAEIARIGHVIVNDRVFFDRRHLERGRQRLVVDADQLLRDKLLVAPERKIERVDHEYPVDGELVHFFRIQRRRFPIEVVAILIL